MQIITIITEISCVKNECSDAALLSFVQFRGAFAFLQRSYATPRRLFTYHIGTRRAPLTRNWAHSFVTAAGCCYLLHLVTHNKTKPSDQTTCFVSADLSQVIAWPALFVQLSLPIRKLVTQTGLSTRWLIKRFTWIWGRPIDESELSATEIIFDLLFNTSSTEADRDWHWER